jgi:hypothetical protein
VGVNVAVHLPVTLRTVTPSEACAIVPALSVAVTTTLKVPVLSYVCVGALPAPSAPSPKFHAKVYGGTPPDGGAATNVKTVAAASPIPVGDVLTPPATNGGITVVVVEVVEVVVVVTVTLTVPSGSLGVFAQRMDTAASSNAIGSSLRTDIRGVSGS